MNMALRQDNPPRDRLRRTGIALMQVGVVLAGTVCGVARAGYLYDASSLPGEKGPPPASAGTGDHDEALACFRRGDCARCLDLLQRARERNPATDPARITLARW